MFKQFNDFFYKKKHYIEIYANWLNRSIWNRAFFVYTVATFSITVRYVLYSLHNGFWFPNSVTFYSALFSYTTATFFLLVFGVFRNITFGDYIRKFIDLDRIHENRIRAEKFRALVAETHNAHNSFKVYYSNPWLIFGVSFFLLAMTSGKSLGLHMSFCVFLYNLWRLFNIFYFAVCMHLTPVPEDLKSIKPGWLIKWDNFNNIRDNQVLMNGVGNVVSESATGSGLGKIGKRVLNNVSKSAAKSFNYVTDSKNTFTIIRGLAGAGTVILGADYSFADANSRTSYLTRAFEVGENGTYSPDPDTRSKAAALRRRGLNLLDCCEPNSKCLNPDLVENKYEVVRPYESKRYLALEEKANVLEEKNTLLEEKANVLEEKNTLLEEENRKLRLNLEGPSLK